MATNGEPMSEDPQGDYIKFDDTTMGFAVSLNLVPETKSWLEPIEKKHGVTILVQQDQDDTYYLTATGDTKEKIEEALKEIEARIHKLEWVNALEILHLSEKYEHHETFEVGIKRAPFLRAKETMDVLKNHGDNAHCVIKVDRCGWVSVFGNKAEDCVQFRDFILLIIEGQGEIDEGEDETLEADDSFGSNSAKVDCELTENDDDEAKSMIKKDEISAGEGSEVSTNKDNPSSDGGNSTATIKFPSGANFTTPPLKNAAESFGKAPSGHASSSYVRPPPRFAARDEFIIENKNCGRVIGKQGSNKNAVESKFGVRVQVDVHKEIGGCSLVTIEGTSMAKVKEAKNDIQEMLKRPAPWETRPGNLSAGASNGGGSGR